MLKNFSKFIIAILPLSFIFFAQGALASLNITNAGELLNTTGAGAGFSQNADVTAIVATIIQAAMGLVGIIFFVLIIYGGVRWMTSAGEEKQIIAAKKLIINAVIGLIIVMAAYSITYFVASALEYKPPTP